MAKQTIGLGTVANDGTGDPLRTAFDKCNDNFDELYFHGAMVKKAANQTGADYTTNTAIAWDSEVYDTDAFHDNTTNNSRFTIPTGVTKVEVGAQISLANATAGIEWFTCLFKNGGSTFDGTCRRNGTVGTTFGGEIGFQSGPIPVVAGDYIEVGLQVTADSSIDITANRSKFWIKAVA